MIVTERKISLNSGLIAYVHRPTSHITLSLDADTCSGTGLPQRYERIQRQLWLISYFRQLLTTKVTTAHWTCMSITPTHEWPSSLEMLKEHTILSYTHYSSTKMCVMKNMWATRKIMNALLKGDKQLLYFVSHTIRLLRKTWCCQNVRSSDLPRTRDPLLAVHTP